MWNIPNIITISRVLLIPLIAGLFVSPWEYGRESAAILFVFAAATDWVDGYLARKWDQTSPFGAFLDPVADKLIVAVTLIILVHDYQNMLWMTIPAFVIISREITISALREWMASIGKRANVAVATIGKVKTTFQMTAIAFLLFFEAGTVFAQYSLYILMIATLLTLWSMIIYLKAAWPIMKGEA
ncbi:MAG: CDP-diacylglycerol--glycerol-3-phosphate 3-phosphatidyltransferase [Saccharospirillaceae bacterium]|nr:CDP-diacylglycerol--glycerol-3-phosphate 3-phosphatidyltransferase [Pseudomonadales bacterium]NRB77878.1 CDP-diacylglycerol--glycerol-3-phosphate 3-phosphatidyltransferase [Saccharospirillaceae bacterium]